MSLRCAGREYADTKKPSWHARTKAEQRDAGLCLAMVFTRFEAHWCVNRARPGEQYCGVHNDAAVERRERERKERDAAHSARWRARSAAHDRKRKQIDAAPILLDAVRDIANGHNDPRQRAAEALNAVEPWDES